MVLDPALSIILIAAIAQISTTAILIFTLIKARNFKRDIERNIFSFFQQNGPDQPSHFAEVCDLIAAIFSKRIISSAEAALRGSAGGLQKAENQAALDLQVQQNPLLGLLGRNLGKNKAAMNLISMLGSQLMSGVRSGPGDNGEKPKFKF